MPMQEPRDRSSRRPLLRGHGPGDRTHAQPDVVYRRACSELARTATRRGVAVADREKGRRSAAGAAGWLEPIAEFRGKRTTTSSTTSMGGAGTGRRGGAELRPSSRRQIRGRADKYTVE